MKPDSVILAMKKNKETNSIVKDGNQYTSNFTTIFMAFANLEGGNNQKSNVYVIKWIWNCVAALILITILFAIPASVNIIVCINKAILL